jgi:hypothetical protein
MDYEALSDFEINVLVAKALGWLVQEAFEVNIGFTKSYHEKYPNTIWAAKTDARGEQVEAWEQLSFTGCWSDAGKLMEDNQIELLKNDNNNRWSASWDEFKTDSINENPKRAIAVCLLMKKAAENV